MKIISIINQKGGVAKTTTAVHLSHFLSKKGFKVLLLDFDPQTDLSKSFGYFNEQVNVSNFLYEFVEPFQIDKNLFLIAGYGDLEEVKISKKLLKNQLEKHYQDYDIILIDCQPQKIVKSSLTINEMVLIATDYILIPIDANANTITGTQDFILSIERVRDTYNSSLKVLGMFFTIVESRENIFKDLYNYLKETSNGLMFDNYIRKDTKLKQASALGKTIFDYDNKARSAEDFKSLGKEIIIRLKENE